MMRWMNRILHQKNRITLVSALVILVAYVAKFGFQQEAVFTVGLVMASLLGVLPIAIQAVQALRYNVVSIDVLVTLAVSGAFLIREFEESAIVTFLFLFGAYLEQRTLNKTRSAIKSLIELAPETALKRLPDGSFETVSVDDVKIDDVVLVKTGARVPVDGIVIFGEGLVNEASITGESMPVEKVLQTPVFAGTIVENGTLQIQATKIGEDTTFGKIIALVEEAQDSKSEAERFIDRFSKKYTPAVLVLAIVVGLLTRDLELAITILVLGCPGALVIGVPVSNVAGIGNGAQHGVLLKGSEVIHDFSRVDTVVFDKTGTLTIGHPEVTTMHLYTDDPKTTLSILSSIEKESDHPLAKAIVKHVGPQPTLPTEKTHVLRGGGIQAVVNGQPIAIGNRSVLSEVIQLTSQQAADLAALEEAGQSIVVMSVEDQLRVVLGIADQVRPNAKAHLAQLKQLGVKHLVLLSGDHAKTVERVAQELGLTEAIGHLLPEHKADYIKNLQAQGHIVAFVGDGINDSPSLATAQIGIAMGHGTDVAIETSDLVLMNSDLGRLPLALGLAKATARNMRQNIAIAIGVVLFLLASVFFSTWMNMSIGMLVHEASILVVILNGMRLLRYRIQ